MKKIIIIESPRNEDWWEGFDWSVANESKHRPSCAFVTAPGSPSMTICTCGLYAAAFKKHHDSKNRV